MNTNRQAVLELNDIPREDLIEMLKEAAWWSADRPEFDRIGFSFDVKEETALRDVNYRKEPLYRTAEAAIIGHWQRHHETYAEKKSK